MHAIFARKARNQVRTMLIDPSTEVVRDANIQCAANLAGENIDPIGTVLVHAERPSGCFQHLNPLCSSLRGAAQRAKSGVPDFANYSWPKSETSDLGARNPVTPVCDYWV